MTIDHAATASGGGLDSALLDPPLRAAVAELLRSIADDEFVIGFWDSEWTGIAPMLEEDVATSSIAQDEIGHARALYELLASVTDDDADAIAFGREPDAYRHAAMLNHARTDWAFTVARRWLYDGADAVRLAALARSSFEPLAQLATKMRREETYHRLHWETWLRRLAGGAPDGRQRLVEALERLWPDAQAIFAPLDGEQMLFEAGILPQSMGEMRNGWLESVRAELGPLGISLPEPPAPMLDDRRKRTDAFVWLHGQFTAVARSEEGATW